MYNLIEDYLDRLCLPLVRRLFYHERQRIRQEVRDHLLERVDELKSQGVSDDEAVAVAIKQFGSPEWVGTLLLEKHTQRPVVTLWRGLVLAGLTLVTAFLLTVPLAQPLAPPRAVMLQAVDAMMWTLGQLSGSLPEAQQLRRTLLQSRLPSGWSMGVPPTGWKWQQADPPLQAVEGLVTQRYSQWLGKRLRDSWLVRRTIGVSLSAGKIRLPVDTLPLVSVCGEFGCVGFPRPFDSRSVDDAILKFALPLLALATLAGWLTRRLRWAIGASVAAVVLSFPATLLLTFRISSAEPARSYEQPPLTQAVRFMEDIAAQKATLIGKATPILSASEAGLASDAERAQRILQLGQLYRHYAKQYTAAWQRWNDASGLQRVWWTFSYHVLPTWWSLPVGLLATLMGGGLGVMVRVWGWRMRHFLLYRFA
ncbi:MAG: permease prefix domain 1-containing protein [Firmicutes bacterium]|nr:permease prefix domain 1-containing protein [Bacillota bacterium]